MEDIQRTHEAKNGTNSNNLPSFTFNAPTIDVSADNQNQNLGSTKSNSVSHKQQILNKKRQNGQ